MFNTWFSSSPEPLKQNVSSDGIAHVFIDCAKSTEAFHTIVSSVDKTMKERGFETYTSLLTYIVSSGSESIDFVDALRIVEIISSFSFTHRIELKKGALEHEASYALMCELGKCLALVKPKDVVFISSPDDLVFSNIVYSSKPTVDILRVTKHSHLGTINSLLESSFTENEKDKDEDEVEEEQINQLTIETNA